MLNTINSGYLEQVQSFLQSSTVLRSSWYGNQRVTQWIRNQICFLVVLVLEKQWNWHYWSRKRCIWRLFGYNGKAQVVCPSTETLMKQDVVYSKTFYLKCLSLLVCVCLCKKDDERVCLSRNTDDLDHLLTTTSWRIYILMFFYGLLTFLIDVLYMYECAHYKCGVPFNSVVSRLQMDWISQLTMGIEL